MWNFKPSPPYQLAVYAFASLALTLGFSGCGGDGAPVDFELLVENQLIQPEMEPGADGDEATYSIQSGTKFTLRDISSEGGEWGSRQWIIDGKRSPQNPAVKSLYLLFNGRQEVKLCLLDRDGEASCTSKYVNIYGGRNPLEESTPVAENVPDETVEREEPVEPESPVLADASGMPATDEGIIYQRRSSAPAEPGSNGAPATDRSRSSQAPPARSSTTPVSTKPAERRITPKATALPTSSAPATAPPNPEPFRPAPPTTSTPVTRPAISRTEQPKAVTPARTVATDAPQTAVKARPQPVPAPTPPPVAKPAPKPAVISPPPAPVAKSRLKVEEEPPPPPPVKPAEVAELSKISTTGAKLTSFSSECGKFGAETASLTLTVRKDIELRGFSLNSDACGKVRITLGGNGVNESVTQKLAGGPRSISLSHLGWRLSAGNSYTLTITPMADGSVCGSETTPGLANAKSCALEDRKTAEVALAYGSRQVIYDFRYYY